MERKSLYDISWQVDEDTYRADKALSYSNLAKYEREGFNGLDHLFDRVETPSLTFGSAVDALITGGQEEFDNKFMAAEFPSIPDSIIKIVKSLFNKFGELPSYRTLDGIPDNAIITETVQQNYQANWRPETRVKVIREKGSEYYSLLHIAGDRTIIDTETYQSVLNTVEALKESETTKFYFADNNPFEPDIERYYQLKFKTDLSYPYNIAISYRCMFDELIVDHENKTIQPIDLKTSSKKEWEFYKSFIEWNYQIQNRLYARILQKVIQEDDYYSDFKILPYIDIVICRTSLIPLVWYSYFTFDRGPLYFGKNKQIEMRDPQDIGYELYNYLNNSPEVPNGINLTKGNDLEKWFNTL